MKALRYFATVMTETTVGLATFAAMWAWTKKDALEILVVSFTLAFLAGMVVLLATDPDAYEEEDEEPEWAGTHIYTLHNGQFYGRKIS